MEKDVYRVLKRPKRDGAGTVIFSIVGNEMYFCLIFSSIIGILVFRSFAFLLILLMMARLNI